MTTPTAVMDAIADRLESLVPVGHNPRDRFHRFQGDGEPAGRERLFKIQLDRGPADDQDQLKSNWRTMELSIKVAYTAAPRVEDRIAEDNELISVELDAMHGWNSSVIQVTKLDLPVVLHLEGAKIVEHDIRLTYIQT